MKHLLIALALAAFFIGCKTRDADSETDRSKAYYHEGENDRHSSKAGHSMHWK